MVELRLHTLQYTANFAILLFVGLSAILCRFWIGLMICPQCRSAECFRSRRSGVFDFLGTAAGLRPWRCHTCDFRFYAWTVAVSFAGYAHCMRCGNFDLRRVPADRVPLGVQSFVKRRLGCRAYRCDLCRLKFFSIRPYRRILPSMVAFQKAVNS